MKNNKNQMNNYCTGWYLGYDQATDTWAAKPTSGNRRFENIVVGFFNRKKDAEYYIDNNLLKNTENRY